MLKELDQASVTLEKYEGARAHEARVAKLGDRLDQALIELVRNGLQISASEYEAARGYIADCRTKIAALFRSTPVMLTPAAVGQAPLGLSSTGFGRTPFPLRILSARAAFSGG